MLGPWRYLLALVFLLLALFLEEARSLFLLLSALAPPPGKAQVLPPPLTKPPWGRRLRGVDAL